LLCHTQPVSGGLGFCAAMRTMRFRSGSFVPQSCRANLPDAIDKTSQWHIAEKNQIPLIRAEIELAGINNDGVEVHAQFLRLLPRAPNANIR
jgi:hypothetical protein